MRLTVTIDDVMIEIDDEQVYPTLEGIESVLKRITEAAVEVYTKTINNPAFAVISFSPDLDSDPDPDPDPSDDDNA